MDDATRIFGNLQSYHRDSPWDRASTLPVRQCQWPECRHDGAHKVPVMPTTPDQVANPVRILWFCRAHARERNANWDFFRGMSAADIERFRREDATWHKPTWKLGTNNGKWWCDTEFPSDPGVFGECSQPKPKDRGRHPAPEQSGPVRDAISVLRLDVTASWGEIKVRYKELVKRHHPDANGGSKKAENKLKRINRAYGLLKTCYRR